MWSHNKYTYYCNFAHHRCKVGLAAVFAILALTACGFTPLYSKHAKNGKNALMVQEALETKVDKIEGRNGQILRNTLMDSLNPSSIPATPRYRLIVTLKEKQIPIGIQQDRQITRYNIVEEATYTLKPLKDGKPLDIGHVRIIGSYDAVDSDFATFVARQDTIKRAMKALARDIHSRVIAAFLKQGTVDHVK